MKVIDERATKKKKKKKGQKRTREIRSYIERVRDKLFCFAVSFSKLGFIQLISKDSLIFK